MLDLDVRGQNEDRDLRELDADRPRGLETLGRMGRRHTNVDDRDVRSLPAHELDQTVGIGRLADDVVAALAQQSSETLAKKHIVIGDRDPLCVLAFRHTAVSTPSERRSQPAGSIYRLAGRRTRWKPGHKSAVLRLVRERWQQRSSLVR